MQWCSCQDTPEFEFPARINYEILHMSEIPRLLPNETKFNHISEVIAKIVSDAPDAERTDAIVNNSIKGVQ